MNDVSTAPAAPALPPQMTWEDVARALKRLAPERSEWAGFPVPMPQAPLTLEPRYPYQLSGMFADKEDDMPYKVVNRWRSRRKGCDVMVVEDKAGKRQHSLGHANQFGLYVQTLVASDAWILEAEHKAFEKLLDLVGERKARAYLLTRTFIETSKRSGVTYLFRALRPTVAVRNERILACLCLHPVGYYDGSWAGAMCPTDDVISHLCMMRGDEPKYWAHANQHSPGSVEAGL